MGCSEQVSQQRSSSPQLRAHSRTAGTAPGVHGAGETSPRALSAVSAHVSRKPMTVVQASLLSRVSQNCSVAARDVAMVLGSPVLL